MKKKIQAELTQYLGWVACVRDDQEQIARARSNEQIPSTKDSDGSQRTSGANDRMANAVLNRIALEERLLPRISANLEKIERLELMVGQLADPLEQRVIRLRYMHDEGCRLMPWRDVARQIYGGNAEKHIHAAHRLHDRALGNLQGLQK